MTLLGKELFQELLTAVYWLKRHPAENRYRITYNRSRYTLDKARTLRLLRLYLPYIRQLDDEKLLDYLYLHSKTIETWVSATDQKGVTELSAESQEELARAGSLTVVEQQKVVDKIVKKETEKRPEVWPKKKGVDKTGAIKVGVVKQAPVAKTVGEVEKVQSISAEVPLNIEEQKVPEAPVLPAVGVDKPTGAVISPVAVVSPKITVAREVALSKQAPQTQPSVAVGPSGMERVIGRAGYWLGGSGVANLAREGVAKISSQGQILARKGAIKGFGAIGSLLPGGKPRSSGGGLPPTSGRVVRWSGSGYEESTDVYGEDVGGGRRLPEEKKPSKWLGLPPWLVIVGAVILIFIFLQSSSEEGEATDIATGIPGPSVGGISGGTGCPSQAEIDANKSSPQACKYLRPNVDLFETNISSGSAADYVVKYSPVFIRGGKGDEVEFRRRVNFIINSAKQAGLNPAIFLGYWKTESNFSTVGTRDMGCAGDNFEEQVLCSMGIAPFDNPRSNPIANCARSRSGDSVACQALRKIRAKPILDGENPITYPISSLDDFAESYGPRSPDLEGGSRVNNNCVSTYNKLLEVVEELGACRVETSNLCQGGWPTTGVVRQGPAGRASHAILTQPAGRYAVDIAAPLGTPVYSTFTGKVVVICKEGCADNRGRFVEIAPSRGVGGSEISESSRVRYLHFSQVAERLSVGSQIQPGDILGYVGDSGAASGAYHLHFDLLNMAFGPPNLPVQIQPPNCDDPTVKCSPSTVVSCKGGGG